MTSRHDINSLETYVVYDHEPILVQLDWRNPEAHHDQIQYWHDADYCSMKQLGMSLDGYRVTLLGGCQLKERNTITTARLEPGPLNAASNLLTIRAPCLSPLLLTPLVSTTCISTWENSFLIHSYYFLFLVLIMKKFDCVKERKAAIPDRSDESTGEALAKFTDYVSAKFDCPRIVKNGK